MPPIIGIHKNPIYFHEMKRTVTIILLLISSMACRDTPELGSIIYPKQGKTGLNILYPSTTGTMETASGLAIYSLSAYIPKDQRVLVTIEGLSSTGVDDTPPCVWRFIGYEDQGWSTSGNRSCIDKIDSIYSNGRLENEISIIFLDEGAALLKVFENDGTTPSHEKVLSW